MTSLCDFCRDPGRCCKSFTLYANEIDRDGKNVPMTKEQVDVSKLEHPFVYEGIAVDGTSAVWSCPKLLPTGRCGDYDNRPALCRNFAAGEDPLCVMTETDEKAA